jgi:apolipoprotein N-acyltransferase
MPELAFALFAAVPLVLAWWLPATTASVALGWSAALGIAAWRRIPNSTWRSLLLFGALTYAGGFHWLYYTLNELGGFGTIPTALVFCLFVLGQSVQFLILGFFQTHAPSWMKQSCLALPVCWIAAERLWVRIFPWELGHTQLEFTYLIQIADLVGTPAITFLMLWLADALLSVRRSPLVVAAPLGAFFLALAYGSIQAAQYDQPVGKPLQVALIQGNVTLAQKHDVKYFVTNRQRYTELSRRVAQSGMLVVWPESVITDFVPEVATNATNIPLLPSSSKGESFLVGALSYNRDRQIFNSAIAVTASNEVLPAYHKMVLMPFGEYMPLSSLFPWISQLNPNAGGFTAGDDVKVLPITLGANESSLAEVQAAPLICYEDILPELSRRATKKGSEILVNLTNDAWFGDSVAPLQHHLIAAFRAVENKRYLLRSTNSGLTAVVDPLGRTIGALPTFSEGVLQTVVQPLRTMTLYSAFTGELIWQLLTCAFSLWTLAALVRRRQIR